MQKLIFDATFIFLCAFLYRWGGGKIFFLKNGFKPARRYILPALIAVQTGWIFPMIIFSIITHFNLQEIEDRRWEEIFLYGMGQAWCFLFAGLASGLIGAWWITGVYLSNIGLTLYSSKKLFKLDWFWVEIVQGLVIGLICV
jgi:hypothetical protein